MSRHPVVLIIFLVGFVFTSAPLWSQRTVLSLPKEYKQPHDEISLDKSKDRFPGELWQVYSDRNNNRTYTSRKGSSVKKDKIGFMEMFYVLQEVGDWVELVKDPGMDYTGKLSRQHEKYGWISKRDLLLWPHCYVDRKTKIDRKGMIINTVEYTRSGMRKDKTDIVHFYYDDRLKTKTGEDSKLYQIFFVYKKTKTAVLLGKTSWIANKERVKDVIIGWVDKNRVVNWDSRIAAEPNWDPQAVQERKRNNKRVQFMIDMPAAKEYGNGGNVSENEIMLDIGFYEKRKIGDWRRYPVIKEKGGVLIAGVMGEIESAGGSSPLHGMNPEKYAEITRTYNRLRAESRNINVVFVVDGTSSVQPYFPTISQAIENSISKIEQSYVNNTIRFGAVVYRDYAEEDRLTEVQKLTTGNRVASFLRNIRSGDDRDRDLPEAVNFGLKKSLRSLSLNPSQTNIIILIGDCGNHNRSDNSFVSEAEVVQKIVGKNAHFLSIQVAHKANQTYQDFIEQSKTITVEAAQRRYRNERQSYPDMAAPNLVHKSGEGVYKLNNTSMVGRIVYQQKGNTISNSRLRREIEDFVKFSNTYIENLLAILYKIVEQGQSAEDSQTIDVNDSTNKYVNSYKSAVRGYLKNMGVSPEQLQFISGERYQFHMQAITPLQIRNHKHSQFNHVIFLNKIELADLIRDMGSFSSKDTENGLRIALQDTWKTLLKKHVGDIAEEDFADKSLSELTELVFGLPSSSDYIKKVRYKDIIDPEIFPVEKVRQYVGEITSKYSEVVKIFNDGDHPYAFMSNDITYYWLDQALLP